MDIAKLLRGEIERRGLTPTELSQGVGLPFSMCSEFIRGGREIGVGKASKIGEFLGLSLSVSRQRRNAMAEYMTTIEELEERIRARNSDDEERIRRRIDTARSEMDRQNEFEHVIVNEPGKLDQTVDRLVDILAHERETAR